jgi:hypothetical protein
MQWFGFHPRRAALHGIEQTRFFLSCTMIAICRVALRLPLVQLHCNLPFACASLEHNDMSTIYLCDHDGWVLRFKAGAPLQKRKAATGAAAPASSKRKKLPEVRLVFNTSY